MQQRHPRSADSPVAGAPDALPSVDVVLLTNDEKLLATLRQASSAHHHLWHADSPDSAIALLVGGRSGILIADLALLEGDAVTVLERLQSQFPELIILATGRREEEVAVAAAISSGCIYRFLHKPVSPARASLFLGTATRRYGELREVEALALATIRQTANRPRVSRVGIGIAVAAAVGALCLWWAVDRKPQRSAAPAMRTPEDEFLSRAQEAFKAGRLADESNDNALALYRSALAAAPDNEASRAGIERVIAALDKRVVVELRRADLTAASAALVELQRAHPAHPHLGSLQRQVRALATPAKPSSPASKFAATQPVTIQAAPPAPRAPAPKIELPLTPQIDRASARLAASQLIAPIDDSAATYLRRAREDGEDESRLKIVATDLADRILQQARHSLDVGDLEQSKTDYDAAAALDAEFELGLPDLESVAQQWAKAKAEAVARAERGGDIPP